MYFEVELNGKKGLAKVNFIKGIIMRILNYDFLHSRRSMYHAEKSSLTKSSIMLTMSF